MCFKAILSILGLIAITGCSNLSPHFEQVRVPDVQSVPTTINQAPNYVYQLTANKESL